MIKGIYTSASGMLPGIKKQEITANNIANASTPGFKKDSLFVKELSSIEKKNVATRTDWENPMSNKVFTDFSQANFEKTGNPLDLAIDGKGFFTLQLDDGSTVLTRSGSFMVDESGMLSFPQGATVMGESGAINVGNGNVTVSQTGIVESDGIQVGRIVPVTIKDFNQLNKIGGSLYALPEGVEITPVQDFSIQQGFLESSNVDIVGEMIEMIVSFREYEANAKALQAQDKSLENLFQRVGGN